LTNRSHRGRTAAYQLRHPAGRQRRNADGASTNHGRCCADDDADVPRSRVHHLSNHTRDKHSALSPALPLLAKAPTSVPSQGL